MAFENIPTLCLALDKRKEHWLEMQENLKQYGIDMIPFVCGDGSDKELVYDQIDEINPDVSKWGYGVPHLKHHHYNAFKGHQSMIQIAKDNGWPYVLILEDDLDVTPRFGDVLKWIKNNPPPDDWKVLLWSWWRGDERDEWNTEVERQYKQDKVLRYLRVTYGLGGLHCVVIRDSLYDEILSLPPVYCLDGILNSARDHIPTYMLLPKIATVKSIYSFTEGCTFNRISL